MALAAAESSCSASASASASASKPRWEHQVFLSFRGEDTRRGFTDHLYAALQRWGITTFRDDRELARGEVISSELHKAIEGSMFAIVVLSPNYASSTWCLEELRTIVECRKNLGQSIIPIFYGVDPSDVRHQRGLFAEAFRKHDERFQGDREKVQRWRDALKEVADISGWDSKDRLEAELIESTVEDIHRKLQPKLPSYEDKLVGIDSKVEEVNSLLGMGSKDVRFIGIWGMGGIGKTTIARVVFERIKGEFEVRCFLENIREVSDTNGLVNGQRRLLSCLRSIDIYDLYEGKKNISNLLCKKKVLLVLDDVSELSQLENLAGEKYWFGPGSRVVVTTRDKHLLTAYGVYKDFEVGGLNNNEALQLFSRKAFKKDQPEEGYLHLSNEVVKYAGGLPLALEVLGSFLGGRTVNTWDSALMQIKNVPHPKILDTLKLSYDALNSLEKKIFLDIACFFKGMYKDQVIEIWENCGLCLGIAIETLIEKSLIKLQFDGLWMHDLLHEMQMDRLWMHDLLQEMGKNIVFEESPNNPGKRSRLWSQEDIDHVLIQNKGTEAIQGIVLDLPKQHEAHWNPEAFSMTSELKLLKLHNIQLPLGLKCLPNALKVLEWRGYPLKALPLNESVEIVYLKMLHSKIERLWIGRKFLVYLKFIDLSFSKNLMQFPDISGVPYLQGLVLEGCAGLVEVHASLGLHKKLVVANFKDCENLKTLPTEMDMSSLEDLILSGCRKVKKLPEFGESMERLSTLYADGTSVRNLPPSLGCLVGLSDLCLKDCKNLVCLPSIMHNLKSLKILNISGCSKLSRLPEGLKFSIFACGLVSMGFKVLPISGLQSLQYLNLSHCNLYEGSLPNDIGCLLSLCSINLSGNNFISLPSTISKLSNLQYLKLDCCRRLQSLPELPSGLKLLDASKCTALETYRFDPSGWSNLLAASMKVAITRYHQACTPSSYASVLLPYSRFLLYEYDKFLNPRPIYEMVIPGSEIPSWFDHQNSRSFVSIQLHHGRPSTELAGLALCFVLVDNACPTRESLLPLWLGYSMSKFRAWEGSLLEPDQPHLYMAYFSADKSEYSQIEVSLIVELLPLEVIKCGCRLVYKEDIEDLKGSGSHSFPCPGEFGLQMIDAVQAEN